MKKNTRLTLNKRKNFDFSFILPILILGLIAILVTINISGNKQSEHFVEKNLEFRQAEELVGNGEFEEAYNILSKLHSEFPKEYNVTYALAYVLLMTDEFDYSEKMYKQALELNPYFVENADVMYQFAMVLFNVQNYEDTAMVISRLETLPLSQEYIDSVNDLKLRIESMKGSK